MPSGVRTIFIIYPEGDSREIEHELRVNQLVDLNGNPLPLPLPSARMIVYRVWKVSTEARTARGEVCYHLELVTRPELESAHGKRRVIDVRTERTSPRTRSSWP